MTQTQPQHQPQAQPESQVAGDGSDPGEVLVETEAQVEHPTPPTYQQIEAFGYQRFTNREQSRLDFGARLLDLAEDDGVPLLERAKFLAIFSELLDEFYQIRVAALEDQVAAGVRTRSVDGLRPGEQLTMIRGRVEELVRRQDHIFLDLIVPGLADAGIRFSGWSSLDDDDREHLVEVFQRQIYPVLTPLAVDPGHPFPYISNLSLNLVVEVQDPVDGRAPHRPGQGAAGPAPLRRHARRRALRAARAGHRRPPGLAVPRHDHRPPPRLPGHPQRRPRPRGGRGGRPPGRHRDGAAPPPLRQGPPARGRGRHGPGPGGPAGHRARGGRRRRLPGRRAARPERAVGRLRPRPPRPARRDLDADDAAPAGPGGARPGRVLRHAARARRAGAPPLRLVRHLGRGLRRPGGRGPGRAGDQADALPHRRRQPDRGGADPGRRERQAGGRHRRAQGALRRGGQHRLGPRARRGGRPRRLRHRRPQDALEDRARAAPRGGRRAPLLPRRHRQLQLQDGPHLRGPRAADLRPRHRRRRRRAVQLPDRLLAPRRLPPDPRVAGHGAQAHPGHDRGAGRGGPVRAASS